MTSGMADPRRAPYRCDGAPASGSARAHDHERSGMVNDGDRQPLRTRRCSDSQRRGESARLAAPVEPRQRNERSTRLIFLLAAAPDTLCRSGHASTEGSGAADHLLPKVRLPTLGPLNRPPEIAAPEASGRASHGVPKLGALPRVRSATCAALAHSACQACTSVSTWLSPDDATM